MNLFIVAGNLGQDPELKYVQGDKPLLRFSVATSTRWKDKESGEQKESTEWHRITLWGPRSEGLHRVLKSGDRVCVRGRLRTNKWEKDGVTRYDKEMIADDITLLGSSRKRDGDEQGPPESQPQARHQEVERFPDAAPDDDIPF